MTQKPLLPIPLIIILCLFTGLCLAFNLNTPYREAGTLRYQKDPATGQSQTAGDIGAPDERQHANYINHLKTKGKFPELKINDPNLYDNYQAHQPPLYYILATAWSTITGSDPTNPEDGTMLRSLNTIIGLASIIGVYFAALWGLKKESVAISASAFFALLPMNVALHSAISNDPLLYCLATWTLALCVKASSQGWTTKLSLTIAALLGFALLTKTTGLALFPLVLVAFILSYKKEDLTPSPNLKDIAIPLAGGLAIAAPWLLRNMSLYGDPFALKVFNSAFTGSPQASMFIEGLGASTYWLNMVMWWTARSFIGAFGYMDIFLFETLGSEKSASIYNAILFLILGIIAFGIISPILNAKQNPIEEESPHPTKQFHILGLTLLIVVTVLFVRFNLTYFQGQARYIFPALAPIAIWFGIGTVALLKSRPNLAWLITVAILLPLNIYSINLLTTAFPIRAT